MRQTKTGWDDDESEICTLSLTCRQLDDIEMNNTDDKVSSTTTSEVNHSPLAIASQAPPAPHPLTGGRLRGIVGGGLEDVVRVDWTDCDHWCTSGLPHSFGFDDERLAREDKARPE